MSMERLPCGCLIGEDVESRTLLFEPHALDCQYYLYVLEQSERLGKSVTTIDLR